MKKVFLLCFLAMFVTKLSFAQTNYTYFNSGPNYWINLSDFYSCSNTADELLVEDVFFAEDVDYHYRIEGQNYDEPTDPSVYISEVDLSISASSDTSSLTFHQDTVSYPGTRIADLAMDVYSFNPDNWDHITVTWTMHFSDATFNERKFVFNR
ncbi:hypothetical protein C8P68_101542 [Mucilaginibacter yixingensis]|uniref:Uncharacterized protein n=1 Tax=Mucilaginibacter yixingensis TaxID=1295612 RepID=A0A2T5JFV8_9SPHI|nr:hypothetical protein [Mucilaginibacter yixingensis]PTR01308.1 hypothetical protein C8P68_101542 [Mucilaginibacter yixingensis]